MASISVPKAAEPNYAILADSAVDASPAFPFHVAPNFGYFALNPNVVYTPGVLPIEVVFANLALKEKEEDWYTALLWCAARKIVIGPRSISQWTDTADPNTITSQAYDPTPVYEEGKEYVFRISAADKDNLTVTIVPMEGGDPANYPTATLTVTDLFAGNPTFHAGFPPDAVLAYVPSDGYTVYPLNSLVSIKEVRLAKTDDACTDLALSYTGVKTTLPNGHDVAYFVPTHPTLFNRGDFKYALTAGQGDTDNASFTIVGDVLRKAGTLTTGSKSIRVTVTDNFGNTYAKALTLIASPSGLYNADITAPVVTVFAIPATDTDYDITISTFTVTGTPSHYAITEEDAAPAEDSPLWVASAPTTYSILQANRAGTGSYTLFAWARDASGNVSASANDTIALTIA